MESGILFLFFSVDLDLRHNFVDSNKNNSDNIRMSFLGPIGLSIFIVVLFFSFLFS